MSNKTLTQCYQLQDQLFTAFEAEKDNETKTRLAFAWDKITTKQRVLRGVPPLKPVDARIKLKRVHSPLALPEHTTIADAVIVGPDVQAGQVATGVVMPAIDPMLPPEDPGPGPGS